MAYYNLQTKAIAKLGQKVLKEVQEVEGSGAGDETPSPEKATEEGGREGGGSSDEPPSPEKATEEGGKEGGGSSDETPSPEKATEEGGKEESVLTTPQDTKAGQRQRMTLQQKDSDILVEMGCLVDGVTESDLRDTEGVLNKIRMGEMCDPFEVSQILLLY